MYTPSKSILSIKNNDFMIENIEKLFGEIKLNGVSTSLNNHILKYLLSEYGYKTLKAYDIFNHIIEKKIEKENNITLHEDIDSNDKTLNHIFNSFDNFNEPIELTPNKKVFVFELEAYPFFNKKTVYLEYSLKSNTISDIYNDIVEFSDNRTTLLKTLKQKNRWAQSIIFDDINKAEQCLTYMTFLSGSYDDWHFEINLKRMIL